MISSRTSARSLLSENRNCQCLQRLIVVLGKGLAEVVLRVELLGETGILLIEMLIEGIGEADFFSMELVEHVLVHPHPAYYLLSVGIHIAHVGLEETIFQNET